MKKLIVLFLLAFAFACAGEPNTTAATVNIKPTQEELAKAKPLNNTICPITLEKIGSMGKAVPVIYKGQIINLCCNGCPRDFAKDPEKYMKLVQAELAAPKAPAPAPAPKTGPKTDHSSHH